MLTDGTTMRREGTCVSRYFYNKRIISGTVYFTAVSSPLPHQPSVLSIGYIFTSGQRRIAVFNGTAHKLGSCRGRKIQCSTVTPFGKVDG